MFSTWGTPQEEEIEAVEKEEAFPAAVSMILEFDKWRVPCENKMVTDKTQTMCEQCKKKTKTLHCGQVKHHAKTAIGPQQLTNLTNPFALQAIMRDLSSFIAADKRAFSVVKNHGFWSLFLS